MKCSQCRNKVLNEGKAAGNLIRHLEEKTKRKPIVICSTQKTGGGIKFYEVKVYPPSEGRSWGQKG